MKFLKRFAASFLVVGLVVSSFFGLGGVEDASATDVVDTFIFSDTWKAPPGVTSVDVECWGGGAGGAGKTGSGNGAGGGGAGAYSKVTNYSVTPGDYYTVAVGVGGAGGDYGVNGSVGGDSYFASSGILYAPGGSGGQPNGTPGSGGLASGGVGDTKFSGENGGSASGALGGGGGGGAGTSSNGGNASGNTGGTGGSNDGGNGGNGGSTGSNGSGGSAFGGGGGGGGGGSGVNTKGASGAHGACRIIYVLPPLVVEGGGTGAESFTVNGVLYGNGTSTIIATAAGSAYQVLRIPSGGGAPEFGAINLSQSAAVAGVLSIVNGGTGTSTTAGFKSVLGAASSGANSDITSLSGLTTPLSVAQGGTGATSTAGLKTAIGAASTGTNSDITSLLGLTTPLSVPQGGTGATSLAGLKSAIGAASSGTNSDITSLLGLTTPLSVVQGGTGATTTFSAGSILFAGASGIFSQDNAALFWDNTNNRLGVGTSAPGSRLEVSGTAAATHFKGTGSTPSIAAGACAGTGGSASISGKDAAGQITVITGTATPINSVCATVTFASAYGSAPHVVFSPANAAAAALSGNKTVHVTSTSSAFSLTVGATSLSNATTYKWEYYVVE